MSASKFKSAAHLFRSLINDSIKYIGDIRQVNKLRARYPKSHIGSKVKIIGDVCSIVIGKGSVIEDGVTFDMQFGGRVVIGERASIRSGAKIIPYGGSISIGNDFGLQHYCILYGHGGLEIGNFVRFAAHSVVVPANHGISLNGLPINLQPLTIKGISLGNDIWIGAGSQILDGVTISDGVVVAAGSVVTKSVSPNMIIGGVPAKEIRCRA